MAWLGFLGKEDPVEFGAALQRDKEEEEGGHPCPAPPAVTWAKNVQAVQKWMGITWERAREIHDENPALFKMVLDISSAEKEAEPLQIKTMRAEQKAEEEHNAAAAPRY